MSICDLGQALAAHECHYGRRCTRPPTFRCGKHIPLYCGACAASGYQPLDRSELIFIQRSAPPPHPSAATTRLWATYVLKPAESRWSRHEMRPPHAGAPSNCRWNASEAECNRSHQTVCVCVCEREGVCACLRVSVWVDRCWRRWGTTARRNLYCGSLIIYSVPPLCASSQSYFGALFPGVITQVVQTRRTLHARTQNI